MDTCLRELFLEAGGPQGVAVVALGGYGRRELAPASDIDLLLLHGGPQAAAVQELAERMFYPLWDAGLTVGHAVRTVDESVALAEERLDAATAILDARLIGGDEDLFEAMSATVLGRVRRDPPGFAARLWAAAGDRHERHGSVSHLLEPDLKEGAGGLRDVHTLGWAGMVVMTPGDPGATGAAEGPVPTRLHALEHAGLVRRSEREAVEAAAEYLLRLRSALHLEAGRRRDVVRLEDQPSLAVALGFTDEPGLPAVDGLMRSTFEHARDVEHVTRALFDRIERGAASVAVPGSVEGTAEQVLGILTRSARSGSALTPGELDAIEAAGLPEVVEWTDDVRDAFLDVLRSGDAGAEALESLDRAGLLVRLMPEWRAVRCRPQRDPYHRYPVDTHLLETLRGVGALLRDPDRAGDPLTVRAAAGVGDPDALLLGALLHDIGKTGEGGHVAVGERIAGAAVERMRMSPEPADLVRFLVREHLLLSDTATRRDLEDENLVLDVAARVGSEDRLAALYLLTEADAQATGPHAWTPWRATLVRELVAKVQHVLERGDMAPQMAERLDERVSAVRGALAGEDRATVDRFLARMPRGYLLAVPADRAARHFHLLSSDLGALEVRTLPEPGSRPRHHALMVAARDRPGLLARIAGALSLSGLSILSAQVFTTEDGLAVDLFELEPSFAEDVTEERWRRFRTTLRHALEGRLSLEYRFRERRRHYPAPREDLPVKVVVDDAASDFFTVVEVGAPDRIGLLFDIASVLHELQLDVHVAKVATFGARVVDAFYVRDVLGRKVRDPDQRDEIVRAITARLTAT